MKLMSTAPFRASDDEALSAHGVPNWEPSVVLRAGDVTIHFDTIEALQMWARRVRDLAVDYRIDAIRTKVQP